MRTLADVLCDSCLARLELKGDVFLSNGDVALSFTEDDLCDRCVIRVRAWLKQIEQESVRYDPTQPDICDSYNGLDSMDDL
jgi:hypothetical protein